MGHATATPDGVALVADTGAAGAFLAPRLFAAAGDLGHGLGAGRAGTLCSVVGNDRLVNRLLALVIVHRGELGLQFALIGAGGVLDC